MYAWKSIECLENKYMPFLCVGLHRLILKKWWSATKSCSPTSRVPWSATTRKDRSIPFSTTYPRPSKWTCCRTFMRRLCWRWKRQRTIASGSRPSLNWASCISTMKSILSLPRSSRSYTNLVKWAETNSPTIPFY